MDVSKPNFDMYVFRRDGLDSKGNHFCRFDVLALVLVMVGVRYVASSCMIFDIDIVLQYEIDDR